MVAGLEKFKEFFAGFEDRYVLIGGVACHVLFTEAGLVARATKDLDIVLCVEVVDAAFAARFKSFLDAGGYTTWSTADGERRFFRFQGPTDKSFPAMIEVFARPPAAFDLPDEDRYVRIPVEEAIISLSALLLDEDYFAALREAREMHDGLPVLNADLLIPFKARAYLDLKSRKMSGEPIDSTTVSKHLRDVFRLLQLLPRTQRVSLALGLKRDLNQFVAAVALERFDPPSFGVPMSQDEGLDLLRAVYRLTAE